MKKLCKLVTFLSQGTCSAQCYVSEICKVPPQLAVLPMDSRMDQTSSSLRFDFCRYRLASWLELDNIELVSAVDVSLSEKFLAWRSYWYGKLGLDRSELGFGENNISVSTSFGKFFSDNASQGERGV